MDSVQTPFLPGICGPYMYLAPVQQCADDTGIVHCHLGLHCQLGVGPHSCCEACKGCGCLLNLLINLCIQGEVVGDGGTKVGELMDCIKLIVIDSDGWWCCGALAQDVCLLQADGQPKVTPGLGQVVHQCLKIMLPAAVGHYCRIISKQQVSDNGFTYFGPGSQVGKIEQPTI